MITNIAVISPLRKPFIDVSFEYNEEKFKASLSFSSGGVWGLWSVLPNGGGESARKMATHFSNQELYFFEETLLGDSFVLAAAKEISSERVPVLA